ncbi:MAG: RecQ family ATP-dependent DNA helicase [Anaerolineales bacterium]|nr:RecQ family ATP-dependent DNA helicase [Anaerolineales bacterium]
MIVNYDPKIHGQVEPVATMPKQPARPVDVGLDLSNATHRQPHLFPVPVQCRPKHDGLQAVLLESTGFPSHVPELVNRIPIEPAARRALTQWRLDFPLPQEGGRNMQDQAVLAVIEKILLRGTITMLSPDVENAATSFIMAGDDPDDNAWLQALSRISQYGIAPYHHEAFDSAEEAIFYSELLPSLAPNRNIYAWTIPQISAASLTNGLLPSESKQRVDFLIAHPNGTQLVIEIDGLQHRSSIEADQIRDGCLQDCGIRVLRIPASEIRARTGPQLSVLRQVLEILPATETDLKDSSLDITLLLGRAAGQIQIALLIGLKTGLLTVGDINRWAIAVPNPNWYQDRKNWARVTQEAARDFVTLLCALYRLYHGEALDLTVDLVRESRNEADLAIIFGEHTRLPRARVIFEVSNIYLPCHIEHSLPAAPTARIINPDHEVTEWFLYYIFRKRKFWEGQWEVISRALQGLDSIVLLPTGGGKSIAFQLASLLIPGPCLVVDPLISLIEDQIDNLRAVGIDRAIGITRLLSTKKEEKESALRSFAHGHYVFCYVVPERLQMEDFRQALRAVTIGSPISLIAVDEAHCVSEWGHDFRTSYLNVAWNSRHYCERDGIVPPLLGLTGTASRSVLKDIQRELRIEGFDTIITPKSFDRQELNLRVIPCRSSEKQARLIGYLAALPQEFQVSRNDFYQPCGERTRAGLIFYPHVNGEMGVETGYQLIREEIGSVAIYSGEPPKGIPKERWDDVKTVNARRFKHNEISVLVCTNAFGMGIDKPNIRYTVHMNLPRSIEAFYQEAGRAGRDRNRSDCCLIVSNDHPERTRTLLNPSTPLSEIAKMIKEVPWIEADDITRMLYFHVNAFHGIEGEEATIGQLIAEIGDIQSRRTLAINYSEDNRQDREKAVHRLVILGVVEDYTHDYAHHQINLRLSGLEKEAVLDHYIKYMQAYDRRLAEVAEANARRLLTINYIPFVVALVRLLLEFIYSTVELGRRRSLAEMLQACMSDRIRHYILNYLELGAHSELLNSAMERKFSLASAIQQLVEQITSPNDAAELRGQTARMLESYPSNPALLLIRSLAELLCKERDEQVGLDNLGAAVAFAISATGWSLSYEEVAAAVAILAESVDRLADGLGSRVVMRFLAEVRELRPAARAIIEKGAPEVTFPAAEALLQLLSDQLEDIIL